MNSDGRSTSQQLYIPTLLVIGGCDALVARCGDAADSAGLGLKTCTLHQAPAAIPHRHPLAIVVPNRVFDGASHELEALARDVRSVLFPVDPEVSVRELEAMFAAAVAACSSQHERRSGAGRYSITDGFAEEAPFSRSTPPPSSRAAGSSRSTSPPSSRAPRPTAPPPSSRASLTARQMLPRAQSLPMAPPAAPNPGAPSAPGLASTRPTEPPTSGTQPVDRPSYAALRAVFSSR